MKKKVLPLMAVAMTLTFSACQPTDTVAPTVEAVKTNDDLILDVSSAAAVNNGGEIVTMAVKLASAQIKSAFDALDEDKSGQISATELISVLTKDAYKGKDGFIYRLLFGKEFRGDIKNGDFTEPEAIMFIKLFDANNSGMMEFNEFERLIEEVLKRENKIK